MSHPSSSQVPVASGSGLQPPPLRTPTGGPPTQQLSWQPMGSSSSANVQNLVGRQQWTWQDIPEGLDFVGEISDLDDLIPADQPARPEDLNMLEELGFDFTDTFNQALGSGNYGTVYPCAFEKKLDNGKVIKKQLAFKTVAINRPARRLDWTIEKAELHIYTEMRICELVIENPHPNIARHELVWRIIEESITYQNPINHLIFMEQCDGSLTQFSTDPKYGFGFTIPDPNAAQNAIGNPQYHGLPELIIKMWMHHVCRGLEYLHEQPKYERNQQNEREVKRICIIHHDVKHDNVLFRINSHGRIKFMLTDFGLSQVHDLHPNDPSEDANRLKTTWSGGSKRFYPDEVLQLMDLMKTDVYKRTPTQQFRLQHGFDPKKKDVYCLGVMMSDSLVGLTDKQQYNRMYLVADKWLNSHFGNLREDEYVRQFGVSENFWQFMFSLSEYDPEDRPTLPLVLKHPWFKDPILYGEYLDWKSVL